MKKWLLISLLLLGGTVFFNQATAQHISSIVPANNMLRDTLVFNAKDYVVQPNDKTEDLLKRLPVIAIDKDGNIYAQNEEVQIVLVDGDEYTNHLAATRNLPANLVDKVKIYYKLSDQAAFTGIEDDIKMKTINILLKKK